MITVVNPDQHDNVKLVKVNAEMLASVCTDPWAVPNLHILFNEIYNYVLSSHICIMKANYSVELSKEVDRITKILSTPRSVFYSVPLYINDKYCGEFNIEGSLKHNIDDEIKVDIRRSWSYILPDMIKDVEIKVVPVTELSKISEFCSAIVISYNGIKKMILDSRCLLGSY